MNDEGDWLIAAHVHTTTSYDPTFTTKRRNELELWIEFFILSAQMHTKYT